MKRRLLEIACLLMLAGCQTPPPTPVPAPPPPAPACPEPRPAPQVQAPQGVAATAEELRKALSLGRSAAELAQTAAQVEAVAASTDPQAEPLKQLAAQLSMRIAEQRRLQDSVDKLAQQLRDSQRRNEQLAEKLEALKAIEQTLPPKPGASR